MRRVILAVLALWLTPVLAAGVFAFGISFWLAVLTGAGLALAAATVASRRLAAVVTPALTGQRATAAIALLLALAAIVQIAPLSLFMADVNRASCAVATDPFRLRHFCFTAYSEASRLAAEGDGNIYRETLYQPRQIGPLMVDPYHYPPPFLLLPTALRVVAPDFFAQRALWFSIQASLLLYCLIWIARWVGGRTEAACLMAALAFLALPQTLIALQTGNFQITALTVSVVALLVLIMRPAVGAATALAFVTLGKIFPGVLVLWLLASRRWRAAALAAGAGVVIIGLAWLVVGSAPFLSFATYEVPRITNGEAFPQSERPGILFNNQSFYGLTVRLRTLGLSGLDAATGLRLTSLYGLAVIALAIATAWRSRLDPVVSGDRGRLAILALALVTLASFRSPFVGGMYGLVSSSLVALLLTAHSAGRERWLWLGAAIAVVGLTLAVPPPTSPTDAPSTAVLVVSTIAIASAIALNVAAVCWTAFRRERAFPAAVAGSEGGQPRRR